MDDGRDGVALRGDGAGEAVGVTSDDGGGGARTEEKTLSKI